MCCLNSYATIGASIDFGRQMRRLILDSMHTALRIPRMPIFIRRKVRYEVHSDSLPFDFRTGYGMQEPKRRMIPFLCHLEGQPPFTYCLTSFRRVFLAGREARHDLWSWFLRGDYYIVPYDSHKAVISGSSHLVHIVF